MHLENRLTAYLLLLLILIVAVFFRFWNLGTMPPGLYHDEAYNGLDALSLLRGETFPQFYEGWELYAQDAHAQRPPQESRFPIFFEGNYGREPIHIYLMALSIAFFDASPFAVRAVPAAAGVLAVLTTFLAARAIFPERGYLIPLAAAASLAVLYPAVHFSRFGIRAMVFVPIETLTIAFFMKGMNFNKGTNLNRFNWVWFLLAGLFLGLSIYTFAAARLFPLLWIVFVPTWFLVEKDAIHLYWRKISVMAAVSFITALPILLFFAQYPYYFFFRIAYVSNKGLGTIEGKPWLTWLFNTGRVLRGFIYLGETHLRHNLPGRPYLDWLQLILFIIGLGRSLKRVLKPQFLLLVMWFVIMLLPSILSGDAPHFGRLIGAAAPAAILIALGFDWIFNKLCLWLMSKNSPKAAVMTAGVFIILIWAASAFWTGRDYFFRYRQHPQLAEDFYQEDWELGRMAASHGESSDIYLSPGQEELATILFALPSSDQLRNFDASNSLIPAGRNGQPILYLLRDVDESLANHFMTVFEEVIREEPEGNLTSLFIPANSQRIFNLQESGAYFDDRIKLVGWSQIIDGQNLLVTLGWQSDIKLDENYTAFVHITNSQGKIISQADREPMGYPTSDWRVKEVVVDQFSLPLPQSETENDYKITTGFYYLPTGERLGKALILGD